MRRVSILAVVLLVSFLFTGAAFAAEQKVTPTPKPEAQQSDEKKTQEKIDINSATLEQLMELSGIGEVIGQRIIDARPYEKPEELIDKVKGIGEKTYAKIKDQIVAGPAQKSSGTQDDGKKSDGKHDEKPAPTPTPKPKQ